MKQKSTDTPAFETDELLALARLDLERGNVEQALAKVKTTLQENAPSLDAMSLAARIYAQLGLYERAQDWYKKIVEENPEAVLESFQLGMTYFDSGESEQALGIWDKILKVEPVHPPTLFYKGLALAQSGQNADAEQSLNTLLQSAPSENLYFGKAKELLDAMKKGQFQFMNNRQMNEQPAAVIDPENLYKTEH